MSNRVFEVTASTLRLRRAPSLSSETIARLPRGQLVARLDSVERGPWWRVFADTPGDGAYVGYADFRWLARWSQAPLVATPQMPASQTPTERPTASTRPPPEATVPPSAPAAPVGEAAATTRYAVPLTVEAFQAEADRLGVGFAEFWAVLEVEARGEGFFVEGDKHKLPQILYERHIFRRLTDRAFDAAHPEISGPSYTHASDAPANNRYGSLDGQYPRLVRAAALNRAAALKSASWGIGQIMGFNHEVVGYPTVEAMVADMRKSEDHQFRAFANFIIGNDLQEKLQRKQWDKFAEKYNGTDYRTYQYDTKLAAKYELLRGREPDILLRRAQMYLKFLRKYRSKADGFWGPGSRGAVADYMASKGETATPEQLAQKPSADFLRSLIAVAEQDVAAQPALWPLG